MEQRVSLITLGVADVTRARDFYERLGWRGQEVEGTVFFQAGSMVLVLWGRANLAQDGGMHDGQTDGFGGVALAQNVRSEQMSTTSSRQHDMLVPQSHALRPRPSTAATRDTSPTPTGTSGRLPITPGFPSPLTARSLSQTSTTRKCRSRCGTGSYNGEVVLCMGANTAVHNATLSGPDRGTR
jgi:hypothetical protein